MKKDILIQAEHIYHAYHQNQVLQDLSLNIHRNEIITLIGPNGAGKSTLVKLLLKLERPNQGKVKHHTDLTVGFMPQKITVDPTLPMTAERFLQLGLKSKDAESLLYLKQISDELNIQVLLKTPIQSISGGEMQRMLLARALINQPNLLVLDEPVQGVDIQGQTELYHYINEIRNRTQCGILMVSHDLHIVMKTTDKVVCLNHHICCSGTPQTIHEHPEYQALFGSSGETEEIALYEHHHNPKTCQHSHGSTLKEKV